MATVPMPPVGGPGPVTRPEGIPVPVAPGAPAGEVRIVAPGWLRGLEVLAGLLSAGVLVLGIGLVVAQVLVPRLGGPGLEAAIGPGWDRVSSAVVVGGIGEVLRALRRRLPTAARAVVAIGVIVAVAALLWFTWWR